MRWLAFILLICGCRDRKTADAQTAALVGERLELARTLVSGHPALAAADSLSHEADRIILLSKDVENPGAAVENGNAAFERWGNSLHQSGIIKLNKVMDRAEIEDACRKNELTLLNAMLMREAPEVALPLSTVR